MTRRLPCPPAPGPLEAYAARFDDLFSTLARPLFGFLLNDQLGQQPQHVDRKGMPGVVDPDLARHDDVDRRARCEDRIRNARDTGLRNLPLHDTAQNQIWLEIISLALDLLAWMPMLALTSKTRRWEPKKLRLRLFSAAAQLVTAPLHRPMALDRRHHPRDPTTHSPAEPRLTSNSDRPEEPQQHPGTVEPCAHPTRLPGRQPASAPKIPYSQAQSPVSEPTRTHEGSRSGCPADHVRSGRRIAATAPTTGCIRPG